MKLLMPSSEPGRSLFGEWLLLSSTAKW